MPYDFTLRAVITATPRVIYESWLDSRAHSAMTGGKATQSAKIDAPVSAWDDYITGRNLDLVPGKRIVQTWRTTQFTDRHGDSVITVTLTPIKGGTRLTLQHANVPDDQTSYEESGWREHYFEPMQRYFLTMAKVAAVTARAKKAKSGRKTGAPKARKTPPKKSKKTAGRKAEKRGKKSGARR